MFTEDVRGSITNWSVLTNTDNATRANFPNGYLVNTVADGDDFPLEIFISRDKRQITVPEINDETEGLFIFNKQ
jgi:hypothetical protein